MDFLDGQGAQKPPAAAGASASPALCRRAEYGRMKEYMHLQRAQNDGPISQKGDYRQIASVILGRFGGPGIVFRDPKAIDLCKAILGSPGPRVRVWGFHK